MNIAGGFEWAVFTAVSIVLLTLLAVYIKCGLLIWKTANIPLGKLNWLQIATTLTVFLATWPVFIFLASIAQHDPRRK